MLTRAYAFYVLARNGQANVSDLRYFSDTKVAAMTSALARGADRRGGVAGGRPVARRVWLPPGARPDRGGRSGHLSA